MPNFNTLGLGGHKGDKFSLHFSFIVSDTVGVQVVNIHGDILQNRRELPFPFS